MTSRRLVWLFVDGWQLTCCLLGLVIVYAFDQYFYEAITAVISLAGPIIVGIVKWLGDVFKGIIDWMTGGPFCQGAQCLKNLVLLIIFGVPLIIIYVVVSLCLLIVLLIAAVPWMICFWLAQNPGPIRYVLDLGLAWFVGLFLYGILFPIIWRMLAPVLAVTVGEFAYERARSRVFGGPMRIRQPLYGLIAAVALIGAGARIMVPIAVAGGTAAGEAWERNISVSFYTPTPAPWPKVFAVKPGEALHTGVYVIRGQTLFVGTTAPLHVGRAGSNSPYLVPPTDDDSPYACLIDRGQQRSCRSRGLLFRGDGEAVVYGGRNEATVKLWQPKVVDRSSWR